MKNIYSGPKETREKRQVSLKCTWRRVKERATALRQDRLSTLKKLKTISKDNYETEKMALHHIGQQTVGASMLIVTPYEEKSYLLVNLFIYSMNECK